jgi:hypothetical protein
MVLSAVSVYAGADFNGMAFQGLSQQRVGQSDGLQGNSLPASTASQAETPAAVVPRQIALADPELASTATKREQLTYLVQCALPADIALYTEHGADRFLFQGRLGLAPRWLDEAMTPSEERWVSACLLARVNYFGKRVSISMRATPPVVPTLEISEEEHQTFSIFEGGFFGNLFLRHPVAYTCRGERTPAQAEDPILQDRICTQEMGTTTVDGKPLTACHFLLTGRCEDVHSFRVDGTNYSEVIFVYLRPTQR